MSALQRVRAEGPERVRSQLPDAVRSRLPEQLQGPEDQGSFFDGRLVAGLLGASVAAPVLLGLQIWVAEAATGVKNRLTKSD